jgi:hypothetical protein
MLGAGVAVLALKVLNRKKPPSVPVVKEREPARIPAELDTDSSSESHEAKPVAKAPKRAVRA